MQIGRGCPNAVEGLGYVAVAAGIERRLAVVADPAGADLTDERDREVARPDRIGADLLDCKRRSENPSLKRPGRPVGPE
jgi:hypothetical protein